LGWEEGRMAVGVGLGEEGRMAVGAGLGEEALEPRNFPVKGRPPVQGEGKAP